MRYYLRLIGLFVRASVKQEAAYRANFFISLLYSLLNLATGVLGILVLFGQIESLQGWTLASTLAILGVYLTLTALNGLFIGPSLEALAGMDGEIWTGKFDYVLLRPVSTQFLASFRQWRPFAGVDLFLGVGVLVAAVFMLGESMQPWQTASFILAMAAGLLVLYSILLAFAGLVFWSPGFMFGWVFDGLLQMARYPVRLYPVWLRFVLTWVIPVGVMTTLPAQAITGEVPTGALALGVLLALVFFAGASLLFRRGLSRYASASS
jgi:ABC-2 type transport system permease protein